MGPPLTCEQWESLPESAQLLFRHVVEGVEDEIQPEKQQLTQPYGTGTNAQLSIDRAQEANAGMVGSRAVVIPSLAAARL